ncbi:MAG TPA: hypothetical protein VIW03_14715, partial [Anaeromyxobacter sp.]
MPDQRSVMKEFRSLEEKRAAGGLTPTEEARLAHLRDLIGPEMGAGSLRPGFDVDAAAAQLRDSLLPAGFRRPPPAPAPAEPVPANAPDDALASVYAAEPFAPLETPQQPEALFDPSSLSPHAGEPAYDPAAASNDPSQPAWDPNVPFDANAAVYDPNASYDPNAQYDANAPYDPNAAYAATEGQDPNAQAGWDPDVPYDPAQPGAQPYDGAAQPYAEDAPADPGAQAWDAAQPGEPGAQAAWDAAATYDGDAPPDAAGLAWDPAASPDAGAQAYPEPAAAVDAEADLLAEPGSAEAGFPSGAEGSRDGWLAEPAGATPEPPYAAAAPAGEDAGLESMLPFDPAAAAAIAPGEVPEGFGSDTGEYDDTAGFDTRFADATPADLPQEEPSFQAAQSIEPEAAQGWQPDAVLEEGFQLASGGSFDAAAEAAAPEWAGGTAAPPWESGAAAEEPSDAFAPPEATPIADDAFVEAPEPGGSAPDAPAEALAELAVEAELAEPLSTVGELAAPPGETPAAPDDFSVDVDAEPAPAGAAQALDFSQPDFSAGSPSEEEAAFVDAAVGPGADAVAVAE